MIERDGNTIERLLKKLEALEKRFRELESQLLLPEVIGGANYGELLREHGRLGKVVLCYKRLQESLSRRDEARSILADKNEPQDLKHLARAELEGLEKEVQSRIEEILPALAGTEEPKPKSVIMEIRSGTGGDEAALFTANLFRMYAKFIERKGWRLELLSSNRTELGGFKEIVFSITGEEAYSSLKNESGGHRVQRVPATETQGRIHTSAATVAVLPEVEETQIEIKPADIKLDTFRSSGPGGQNVNKVSSAVRITHLPTGLVVACQDEQSQHKNRAKAMRILRTRLYDLFEGQKRRARDEIRRGQVGSGDRSDRIRTYNFPQNRVSDHRLGLTLKSLDRVMGGDLDEIVEALMTKEREEQLAKLAS